MLDLSHLWIVLYALRSPTSLLVMHGALLNARRCVSLSGSSLLGDYASVVGHHHFKSILSGWVEGKLLFHRLWLASAGQWKMASRAPPTRFQHCSGNEIVCVCVCKPCISILYLSLVMSRELWQRPLWHSVCSCAVMRNNIFLNNTVS